MVLSLMTDRHSIGPKALIPNRKLQPLQFLIGNWTTRGTHPAMPGRVLRGRTSFAWHEGGAFLVLHSQVDEPDFPDGVAIIGSDDGAGKFSMIYFDERGTSRIFDVSVSNRTVSCKRDDPVFAQSLVITVEDREGKMTSTGKMSRNGGPWTDDLSQVFERED
jgi:hypothetical protein